MVSFDCFIWSCAKLTKAYKSATADLCTPFFSAADVLTRIRHIHVNDLQPPRWGRFHHHDV